MKTHNFKLMLLAVALGTTIPVIAQAKFVSCSANCNPNPFCYYYCLQWQCDFKLDIQ